MKLFDLITNSDPHLILFSSPKIQITVQELNKEKELFELFLASLATQKVVLNFNNNLNLAKWLTFLDGIVSRMTILPYKNNIEEHANFIALSESNILISDTEVTNCSLPSFNINNLNFNSREVYSLQNKIETQWVITTSGTTGTPKLVKHTLASLTNTVKQSSNHKSIYAWGLLFSLERFAGIQVFLQAITSANKLVIPDNQSLAEEISFFEKNGVNCLSATPTLWRKILMTPEIKKLSLKAITLGGEIADDNILKALSQQFPQAKIRHIYASTEAGSGFSVTDGLAGFPEDYLNNSTLNNLLLKISDKKTLLIKSKSKSTGYLGNKLLEDNDGFIDTGDLIRISNKRCYFEGRENGSINIGGNKVQPEYIENLLIAFPGVKIATITAKKSSIMGNLIQANIVIDKSIDDHKEFISQLKCYCKDKLESFMIPTFFKVVDDIKLNATGKVLRNE